MLEDECLPLLWVPPAQVTIGWKAVWNTEYNVC